MKKISSWLMLVSMWLCAAVAHAGTVTYVYTDPQGTPLAETDASGNITARFEYTPYGVSVPSMGAAPNGVGYTGHVNDPESGFVYIQARYYDPVVGRFLSVDPVGLDAGDLYAVNKFAYVDNNPINATDPTGKICIPGLNYSSPLCVRSRHYLSIAKQNDVAQRTTFFTAAAVVTNALATQDIWGFQGSAFLQVHKKTAQFLKSTSDALENHNMKRLSGLLDQPAGNVEENDNNFVHEEQTIVQDRLNSLAADSPSEYRSLIGNVNNTLNTPTALAKVFGNSVLGGIISQVRSGLGRDIDFAKQGDREAIGRALTKYVRDNN